MLKKTTELMPDFRPAADADLEEMLHIVAQAVRYFRENGIDQWQNGYPNRDTLVEDIALDRLYVLYEAERVVAFCALCFGEEPTYRRITGGAWPDEQPYATIHRSAVLQEEKGHGLAGELFAHCARLTAAAGVHRLRADTHEKNLSMQKALRKAGFKACGVIFLQDGSPRDAFSREV